MELIKSERIIKKRSTDELSAAHIVPYERKNEPLYAAYYGEVGDDFNDIDELKKTKSDGNHIFDDGDALPVAQRKYKHLVGITGNSNSAIKRYLKSIKPPPDAEAAKKIVSENAHWRHLEDSRVELYGLKHALEAVIRQQPQLGRHARRDERVR